MTRILVAIFAFILAACAAEPPTSAVAQPTLIQSTGNGTTITIPSGTTTATIMVRHHGVTIQGSGSDVSKLVADGHNGYTSAIVIPYPAQTPDGLPVSSMTLSGFTVDAGSASLVTVIAGSTYSGPLSLTVDDVKVVGLAVGEIAFGLQSVTVDIEDVEIQGDGRAFNLNGTSGTIDGVIIEGGNGGFIVSSSGASTNIDISNVEAKGDYWQGISSAPMTATGFGATYVDVVDAGYSMRAAYDVVRVFNPIGTGQVTGSTVVDVTGLAQFDRVETAAGVWAQVEGYANGGAVVGPWHLANSWIRTSAPVNTTAVTGYRLTLGRLWPGSWTTTRLGVYRWRYVDGRAAPTPSIVSGQRVDVRQARSGSGRDVDVGAVHFTAPCDGCSITDGYFRGYFSDQVTLRGNDSAAERVTVELGQDMGFTIDGDGSICTDCRAEANGIDGMCVVDTATNATIVNFEGRYNGIQAAPGTIPYGSWQWGIYVYGDADILSAGGFGNANGIVGP